MTGALAAYIGERGRKCDGACGKIARNQGSSRLLKNPLDGEF
jgi:hypothetical protein